MTAHPPTQAGGGHPGGDEDAEAEAEAAAAAVMYAYQRADGRRHDLDPVPPEERTWTTWSFLSL